MNAKKGYFSACYMFIALAVCITAEGLLAEDDHVGRVKIKSMSTGMFMQLDKLDFRQGREITDVSLADSFEITVGDVIRTGRFTFPPLLVVNLEIQPEPDPPVFPGGHTTGAPVWIFDDGVICNGPTSGEFNTTGFGLVSKAKLEFTNGSRMNLKIRDVAVKGSVSVFSEIGEGLIFPGHDH